MGLGMSDDEMEPAAVNSAGLNPPLGIDHARLEYGRDFRDDSCLNDPHRSSVSHLRSWFRLCLPTAPLRQHSALTVSGRQPDISKKKVHPPQDYV